MHRYDESKWIGKKDCENSKHNRTGVAVLISGKKDFKTKVRREISHIKRITLLGRHDNHAHK